jgi:hypothetical protein
VPDANSIQHGGDHYKGAEYQHWDWAWDCRLNGFAWAASKYAFRWRKKNGLEDLRKCEHYIDKAAEVGATGSSGTARNEQFWELVRQNNVDLTDAAIIHAIMEGSWDRARALVQGIIAQTSSDDRTDEIPHTWLPT